jgi:hemoglobin
VSEPVSVYEAVGGAPFFDDLVARFYESVVAEPLLRPLYPDDLTASVEHLSLFLQQYWGGPVTYNEQRGHPRLRQRHMPFVITEAERDAWFRAMAAALDKVVTERGTPAELEARMLDYFAQAAEFLVNAR